MCISTGSLILLAICWAFVKTYHEEQEEKCRRIRESGYSKRPPRDI